MAHFNGVESFWGHPEARLLRDFKHLQRYVNEFSGRHNIRDKDTLEQMCLLARGMVGKRLRYKDLVNGESAHG